MQETEPLSADARAALEDSLKRCPAGTFEAAIAYREGGDITAIPKIVEGIAERFLEPDVRPKLRDGNDNLRLFEDLGLDSLTMVEVVILVEEVLQIKIENEELRDLRTLGDVKEYIDCKAQGLPLPEKPTTVRIEEICEVMPQQPPFLFLQEARVAKTVSTGVYRISGDEHFLEGHFKNNPVFPGSILLESLGQLGVLHLLKAPRTAEGESVSELSLNAPVDASKIYFTSADGVRAQRVCKPGDILELTVRLKRLRAPLATFEGSITVNGEKAAFAEEITLTFAYEGAEG